VDEVKHFYTDLINTLVKVDKEKLHVFEKNGLYLVTNLSIFITNIILHFLRKVSVLETSVFPPSSLPKGGQTYPCLRLFSRCGFF